MSCCPPGSLGLAPLNTISAKGKMVKLPANGGRPAIPCYKIGPDQPKRVVLVFPDVFGIHSGLHKAFCDALQEKMGQDTTAVWLVDVFRNKPVVGSWKLGDFLTLKFVVPSLLWASKTTMAEQKVAADFEKVIVPALPTENVASIGFCIGSWFNGKFLGQEMGGKNPLKGAIGCHPAWQANKIYFKDEMDIARGVGSKPYLSLAASNDDYAKLNTPVTKFLAEQRGVAEEKVSIEFPDVVHGFVTRGDPTDEKVRAAQERAVAETIKFFDEHIPA